MPNLLAARCTGHVPPCPVAAAHRAIAALWLCTLATSPGAAADLETARNQFLKSCGTCHTVTEAETGRAGPNLHGVYGRPAGSLPGFAYSDALKGGGWVWDDATLDRWIENAQEAHPGTFMSYSQADPAKRALVIEFLRSEAAGASVSSKP